jgi:SPP1 family predicted phage head-tail adaptor
MTGPQKWPAIDPGRLIHRIAIQRQTTTTDISGTVVAWSDFVTTWAAIEPVRGLEVLRAGQDTTQLYLTVTIRWQSGILPNMRVRSSNGTYEIQSIENPGERNILLVLNCLALGNSQ